MIKQKLPDEWKKVELGDIFSFQKKSTIKAGEGLDKGDFKFFTSSNKQSKFINKYTYDGEFLIFATGGHAGIHYCNEKFATSTDCFIVKVDEKILTKYVYYYLFSKIQLLEEGFKGAGLKHISKGYIQDIKLYYPEDIETQKKIVSILEKAEKAKEWRKEADDLTKDFLKSIFLEMFIDDSYEKAKIGEIVELVTKGTTPTTYGYKYQDSGIPFLRAENIDNKIDFNIGLKFINEETHDFLKRSKLKKNDVLFTIAGVIGRSAVVKSEKKININQAIAIIRVGNNINPYYLSYLMQSDIVKQQIDKKIVQVAQANLSLTEIRNLVIPLPPIELQNKFASIVKEIDSTNDKQKQAKSQIDNLFNVLMQKAFNAELVI